MNWWNNLDSAQKTQYCDINTEWLGIRRWETLTGRKIDKVYQLNQEKTMTSITYNA